MLTIQEDHAIVLDAGRSNSVWALAFQSDGMHLLGGSRDGIRRWQFADGQEVGRQTGMDLNGISVSMDHKWIVCGTREGASVWDGQMDEKIIEVEGKNWVYSVDVSPDSTRFATGTGRGDNQASIWNITTGKRLVGPFQHANHVTGVKFSPNGERIATACYVGSIYIFDSRNGRKLITVKKAITPSSFAITPLAWSNDGRQIFVASHDKKIKSFNASKPQH